MRTSAGTRGRQRLCGKHSLRCSIQAPHLTTGLVSSWTVIRIAPCSILCTPIPISGAINDDECNGYFCRSRPTHCGRKADDSQERSRRSEEEVLFSRKTEW